MSSAAKVDVGKQVKDVFYPHRRRYGARRIAAQLKAAGLHVGRFAVGSQMRRLNLRAIGPRRFRPQTTDSRHNMQARPNLLRESENVARSPREVMVGEMTYLPIRAGRWSYLASWQDKFSKRIVGWAVADSMSEDLVISAFAKAIASGGIKPGTIIHRDRGSQYVCKSFRHMLQSAGCRQSMSRRGNCYDNAQAESFFSRYKAELLEGGVFEDLNQVRSETITYIEGYYNRVRGHSALGYKTPEAFEMEFNKEKKGSSSKSFECGIT